MQSECTKLPSLSHTDEAVESSSTLRANFVNKKEKILRRKPSLLFAQTEVEFGDPSNPPHMPSTLIF